ncbi:MAG: sulfatase-like hydrolase/transferase [Blastocatellia bacterium]
MTIANGISRIGWMSGGKAALWKDEEMADVFTSKAVSFIEQHKARPFFLYFALQDPHVPRVPHPRFVGKSGMGPRGDAILQADWCVGEILGTLERLQLARNTLVIFTSDNGPVVDDGYKDEAVEKLVNHKTGGPFRGGKYSNFEAGTRVPWLVRWPGKIQAGMSSALMAQMDCLATFAALTKQALTAAGRGDSQNILPALLGKSRTGRRAFVEQAGSLSLRAEQWKYIAHNDGAKLNKNTNIELGNDADAQLYNVRADPGETQNLAARYPQRVAQMQARLEAIKNSGR